MEPKGQPRDIAIIPTILSAVKRNPKGRIIEPQDLKIKLRAGHQRLLMLIVLDASDSMRVFIPIITRMLLKFQKIAWRMRSLVGLITCYRDIARIVTYPTTNINKLLAGLFDIEFSGKTPLAKGLLLAHRLLRSLSIKNPDAIPRILLISDGLANIPLDKPLDPTLREIIPSEAQADVLAVAKLLSKRRVKIIAVNPWHITEWHSRIFISPTRLLIKITEMTRGVYIGIDAGRIIVRDIFTTKMIISDKEANYIADNIIAAIFESLY